MDTSRLVITVGTGLTAFLLVGGLVSALLEPYIAFSVFIGIPVGLVAAIIGVTLARSALGREPSRLLTSAFAGVAAFGYAIVVLYAVRYAVPATRQTLEFILLPVVAIAAAVAAFAVIWVRTPAGD